jgi:hypothetical protein
VSAHAREWGEHPLLSIDDGSIAFGGVEIGGETAELEGKKVDDDAWRAAIEKRPDGAAVLGVHLPPDARIADLEKVVRAARRAGYAQVALQARGDSYPYPLREYRIATRRRDGTRVKVRSREPVQVLVQAIGTTFERADEVAAL